MRWILVTQLDHHFKEFDAELSCLSLVTFVDAKKNDLLIIVAKLG